MKKNPFHSLNAAPALVLLHVSPRPEHDGHVEQLKERVGLRKHHDERLALRSQMKVEEAERRLIEDLKAEEKEKAEVGMQDFVFGKNPRKVECYLDIC